LKVPILRSAYIAPRFVREYPPKFALVLALLNVSTLVLLLIKLIPESEIVTPQTYEPKNVDIYIGNIFFCINIMITLNTKYSNVYGDAYSIESQLIEDFMMRLSDKLINIVGQDNTPVISFFTDNNDLYY